MFKRSNYGGWEQATEYQLHSSAVSLAGSANKFSRAAHRKLDEFYEPVVATFRGISSAVELMEAWESWAARGEVIAAYWAAITHPCCDSAASETLSQEMHMAAHTAFIGNRTASRRIRALQDANNALDAQNARMQGQLCELRTEVSRLREALVEAREEARRERASAASAVEELQRWRSGDQIALWDTRLATLTEAHAAAKSQYAAERKTVASLRARIDWLQQRVMRTASDPAKPEAPAESPHCAKAAIDTDPVPDLTDTCVLCVGGRASLVPKYRALIGRAQADFLYHDGGVEDHLSRLPALLSSAHAVICFSGEVSHAAYRAVKRYCKVRGKPCALIQQPSMNGLNRALAAIRDLLLLDGKMRIHRIDAASRTG